MFVITKYKGSTQKIRHMSHHTQELRFYGLRESQIFFKLPCITSSLKKNTIGNRSIQDAIITHAPDLS